MAVRLSALHAGRALTPEIFLYRKRYKKKGRRDEKNEKERR
jgi:hypothetical protein